MTSSWVPEIESVVSHTRYVISHKLAALDASQNWDQVCRVLALSQKIFEAERASRPEIRYNFNIITLAILLHTMVPKHGKATDQGTPLSFLRSYACPPDIAHAVDDIANAVSYATELNSPSLINSCLKSHPELAIVQDAHRLCSIGATGIARFFTFEGTAKGRYNNLDHAMHHQLERCDELEAMMKTQEGKRIAAVRVRKLKMFGSWWEEERMLKE